MELDVLSGGDETDVGGYFLPNYPPFSVWSADHVPAALAHLNGGAQADAHLNGGAETEGHDAPLGIYLHIPFCRQRCRFCYYRVYTDKNARDIEAYLDALIREIGVYSRLPVLADREVDFVYFGGGTPSYLSSAQLRGLVDRLHAFLSWDHAREVTFECEPGTLRKAKLQTIRDIGTTRLSLGVEHFDDAILEDNGRAHKSAEVYRAYEWAREVGFPQINIDLIAGMVGDTRNGWDRTVERALAMAPDSLTVYQMEVPPNSVLAREARQSGTVVPVPDWATKRAWVDHAFRVFEQAGYEVSSAYTVVKPSEGSSFRYRDALWRGADMVGVGVASFSYVRGMHFQNADQWDTYIEPLDRGVLPLARAYPATPRQRLIRELILQLKLGSVDAAYFRAKFGADILSEFADAVESLVRDGMATVDGGQVRLSRAGLLSADELLPRFFEAAFVE